MGFVVGPPEVKIKARQYRGSLGWSFGVREIIFIVTLVLIALIPRLFLTRSNGELIIYVICAFAFVQILVLLWTATSKWVATLRPSGIEYRSWLAASFGLGRWKRASWTQVEALQSTKTFEKDGMVFTRGVQMDISDPDSPSGLYNLRVSASEFSFMEYLEAMVRWTDPAKVDPDLRRILESANWKKLEKGRQFWSTWGLVIGLILGFALISSGALPRPQRWMVEGGVWIVAMAVMYLLRLKRRG